MMNRLGWFCVWIRKKSRFFDTKTSTSKTFIREFRKKNKIKNWIEFINLVLLLLLLFDRLTIDLTSPTLFLRSPFILPLRRSLSSSSARLCSSPNFFPRIRVDSRRQRTLPHECPISLSYWRRQIFVESRGAADRRYVRFWFDLGIQADIIRVA